MMNKSKKFRMLIIGLDSATLTLIKPWAEKGFLPNLACLLSEGAWGMLESTIPAISPPAWTSFMTGKNPGKHGTFDFVYRRPGTYHLAIKRNNLISLNTLFRVLSEYGYKIGVVNVPFTYPPEPVNGIMISGLGAPDNGKLAYPPLIARQLRQDGYKVNLDMNFTPCQAENFFRFLVDRTYRQYEIIKKRVLEPYEFDVFIIVFRDIDTVHTFYWHYMDESHPLHKPNNSMKHAIRLYHQIIDEIIGDLLAFMDEQKGYIFIISDHGSGPLIKEVFLNNWLAEAGYLTFRVKTPILKQSMRLLGFTRERLTQLLGNPLTERLKSIVPTQLLDIVPRQFLDLEDVIDWSKTVAYSYGSVGQIYINLMGREPRGIVKPGKEYRQLLQKLMEDLLRLKDPDDNKPVVTSIYVKDEIYSGPYTSMAPDLVVIFRNMGYTSRFFHEFATHEVFALSPTFETGFHRQDGLYIIKGPGIKKGFNSKYHIQDIAPTIMRILGISVPQDVDGQLMSSLFDESHLPSKKIYPVIESDSSDEIHEKGDAGDDDQYEQNMLRHLRHLGYL